MRQVPGNIKSDYLIVGNGKLARHLVHYFTHLNVKFIHWHRESGQSLRETARDANKIILLISDDAILPFIEKHSDVGKKTWIHCSGALSTHLAESAHPLMTFTDKLYDPETYKKIVFVTESGRRSFSDLFPELPNKSYTIKEELKTYYHAWCSIAGNFTTLLWTEFFDRLHECFNISKDDALPYLKQITENLINTDQALTGPFARGDVYTINKHMSALNKDSYADVYKAFYNAYSNKNDTTEEKL